MSRRNIQLLVNFLLFLGLVVRLSVHSSLSGENISFLEIYILPAIIVTSGFAACLIRKWYLIYIPYIAYGICFINFGVPVSYVLIGLLVVLADILLNIHFINAAEFSHVK